MAYCYFENQQTGYINPDSFDGQQLPLKKSPENIPMGPTNSFMPRQMTSSDRVAVKTLHEHPMEKPECRSF
ncbi:hypothetical protein UPYG_G00075770 [Umbra pygmaea]|uniref:Uncharacterized protein n=1 Tax=Umbra pygmaea TaxID=75934 RepID=A0ABD0XFU1_UMBPY